LSDDTGDDIELDVIALCCDYEEDKLAQVLEDHQLDSLEDLQDHTMVIELDDDRVLYQVF
jgi:hypothetical protein